MGTGWRRAFCTIPSDPEATGVTDKQQQQTSPNASPIPRSCGKLGFLSIGSNPTTPRQMSQSAVSSPSLRCRTTASTVEPVPSTTESPNLHCKTTPKAAKTPKLSSNPSSPRSPFKLSLFRNSFKLRSSCGICLNSVKTGQGTAIYTAECAHAFHFPCIAAHVRKHNSLVCPVCNSTWKDVPLLAVHKNLQPELSHSENDVVDNATSPATHCNNNNKKPEVEEKKVVLLESSPRAVKKPEPQHEQPPTPKSSDSRSYDDDEPLLSPTVGGSLIVPIPEADENADEEDGDVEEFPGFLVNPIPSSLIKPYEVTSNGSDTRNVQVRLLPEAAVVSVSRGYETYAVALRVKAPPTAQPARGGNNAVPILEPSRRAPIDLVTVLDVSGSMAGAKMQMLKRAMRLVISSLGSADRLSIVAFSSAPKRLLPLRRMTTSGRDVARRIIDRLACGQGTSVGDALRKAIKVLEDRRERNPVATIMLLSDGQDDRVQNNVANQRNGSSHVSSARFAHIEIPVHAFGFGQRGGYSHEPAEDAFAKCVGGLLSVVVQDLRIQLNLAAGSAPADIAAVYSCNARPTVLSSGSVRLGDLYADEARELLIELRVPSAAVGSHHALSVRCLYKDSATQEVVYGRDQALLVPRPHAVRSSAPKIERLRNLFIATRAIAEARRLVDHGDFTSAHHLLASSRALILQSRSMPPADEYVRSLETELAEVHWRRQHQMELQQQKQQQIVMIQRRRGSEREAMAMTDEDGEPLTPTSAWRAAEKLAKVAMMKKSLDRVSHLHGLENARF